MAQPCGGGGALAPAGQADARGGAHAPAGQADASTDRCTPFALEGRVVLVRNSTNRCISWGCGGSAALNRSTQVEFFEEYSPDAMLQSILRPLLCGARLVVACRVVQHADVDAVALARAEPHGWREQPETFLRALVWINYRMTKFLINAAEYPLCAANCDDLFELRATCRWVYSVSWGDPEMHRYLTSWEPQGNPAAGHAVHCARCVRIRHGRHLYHWACRAMASLPRSFVLPTARRVFRDTRDVHYAWLSTAAP